MGFRTTEALPSRFISGFVFRVEPLILFAIIYANFHVTEFRLRWAWLFLLFVPILVARYVGHRRLWTRTRLDLWLGLFVVLCIINIYFAPYTRGWVMLLRLGASFLIYWTWVEFARARHSMRGLLVITIGLGLIVGLLGLTATQWVSKSAALDGIINLLPGLDASQFLPDAMLSFNPNEIGGALAWLCPFLYGLMFLPGQRATDTPVTVSMRLIKWGAPAAFMVVALALFLGQSRFAIFGVLAALLLITWAGIPAGRKRYVASIVIGIVAVLELALVFNVFPFRPIEAGDAQTASALSERDEDSLSKRGEIWASGIRMVQDYPLTGIGMAMFRTASRQNAAYLIPSFEGRTVPHAHNEWLQIMTDLGIPGLIVFMAWYGILGYMLWRVWQTGQPTYRLLAASLAGVFIAHSVFGLGDAITLWDRFTFVFWWFAGLTGGLYVVTQDSGNINTL